MWKLRRIVVAVLLLVVALGVDRVTQHESVAIADQTSELVVPSERLTSLGPIELLASEYIASVGAVCVGPSVALGIFGASAIPGLAPGTDIATAGFTFGPGWSNFLSFLDGETVKVLALNPLGGCGTDNPVVTVSGLLSTGDSYVVTVIAS